jgi:alkanesulfonate monooxygenase SsuD/methylene tetrahydromethanopterin reductase-like flavin-dependent oxidoreductase (luciferase family)
VAWAAAEPALDPLLPPGAGGIRDRAAGRAVVGDVDEVIDEIARYAEIGVNHLICRLALPEIGPAAVRRSLLLLGRGVAPHFRMFNLPPAVRARTLAEVVDPMIGYLSTQDPA